MNCFLPRGRQCRFGNNRRELTLAVLYSMNIAATLPPPPRYDPDTDSWSSDVAPLSSPRSGVCLLEVDGHLWAFGGFDGMAATHTVERCVKRPCPRNHRLPG